MLRTARLLLRPPRARDAASIARHANNRSVSIGLRDVFPYPYTLRDAKEFIESLSREDPICTFGIEYESEIVGVVGLVPKSDIFRHSAELGYWIGEPFWGRGIATEALGATVDYAFGELGLDRLYSFVFDSNPASARVLEKCGFTREGTLRRGALKNGRFLDTYLYARLKINN